MLEASGLAFAYNGHPVLAGIDLSARRGEVTALLGPNGTGKTTLLRCLLGILTPSAGRVLADGRDVRALRPPERARLMAYVPQDISLRFPMTVFEAVLLGRRPYLGWRPSETDLAVVENVLSGLGLGEFSGRDLTTLSGGQRQKVALARALAQETDFLLLDEPTSSLDLKHQIEVLELAAAAARQRGMGVVMALHEVNMAARYADQVALLCGGAMAALGAPDEVLDAGSIGRVYGVAVDRYMGEDGSRGCWFPLRAAEGARQACEGIYGVKGEK